MSYPCRCCEDCSVTVSNCDSGNCFKVASLTIHSSNSVLPCGSYFSYSIKDESDLSNCDSTVNWAIASWDEDAFENVAVDSDGVVSGNITSTVSLNTFYEIVGKAVCTGTLLSQFFKIRLSVKNACLDNPGCPDGESCDPCDGQCKEPVDIDLS